MLRGAEFYCFFSSLSKIAAFKDPNDVILSLYLWKEKKAWLPEELFQSNGGPGGSTPGCTKERIYNSQNPHFHFPTPADTTKTTPFPGQKKGTIFYFLFLNCAKLF